MRWGIVPGKEDEASGGCLVSISIQVLGSLLVLISFVALQARRMQLDSRVYLLLNVIGSGELVVSALWDRQWGFLALDLVWTSVSAFSLCRTWTGRDARVLDIK
ncbi:MAG: hypothetical protein DLM65_04115 [Candidatus Aeolococcus gillhamiae]|uniref:CBU-0592-like domain-containing protein n=1 Tax=Candidatus Aeolococcus gillhamiae TaxID=3127015 RepID=A0A2W5ZHL3_9BACT|nr:MAG: hypothetical protein DLM65_04115 [Candidatus Dormibacter sp. RRmetagenome_bin12]